MTAKLASCILCIVTGLAGSALAATVPVPSTASVPVPPPAKTRRPHVAVPAKLEPVVSDPRFELVLHPETILMSGDGRQPYLFVSSKGTLFCQAQLSLPPFNTKGKQVYHTRINSVISRDAGQTWTPWTRKKDHDDVFIEGGMVERSDGTILMFDTFIMQSPVKPDHGVGELWKSRDDLQTVQGFNETRPQTTEMPWEKEEVPEKTYEVDLYLPGLKWSGSTNDFGKAHSSARAHRSLIELPNGDLLLLVYTRFNGDTAPASYMPTMLKSRVIVVRSKDGGATWAYLSTVGVDAGVGTEGFGEPVFVRVSQGKHAGRLICLMRTGRDMYRSNSDDQGVTWSRPMPEKLPGIDLYDTDKWEHFFADKKAPGYYPSDEMIGAAVDPDLIEMKDGTLVCAVGMRVPGRKYNDNWRVPQNGNYLAFSTDGGDTWSHVVQFRSGAPTTHYIAVREIKPDLLYVVYDDSAWNMHGNTMGFQLEVKRSDRK